MFLLGVCTIYSAHNAVSVAPPTSPPALHPLRATAHVSSLMVHGVRDAVIIQACRCSVHGGQAVRRP